MSINITVCTFIRSLLMTKFEPKEGAIMPLALQTVNSTETSTYNCSSRHPCRPSTNYRYGRLHSALCALPLVNLRMDAHSQHLTRSIQERGQAHFVHLHHHLSSFHPYQNYQHEFKSTCWLRNTKARSPVPRQAFITRLESPRKPTSGKLCKSLDLATT